MANKNSLRKRILSTASSPHVRDQLLELLERSEFLGDAGLGFLKKKLDELDQSHEELMRKKAVMEPDAFKALIRSWEFNSKRILSEEARAKDSSQADLDLSQSIDEL